MSRGFQVIAITGPRQSGKSTLARAAFPRHPYVTLEDPDTRALARSDPRRFLARFPSGAGTQTVHDVKNYSVQTLDRLVVRLVREELARLARS